jgi:hypothetical protein
VKAFYVGFLAVEAVVLAALWTVAVSGFWNSVATGVVACVCAAAVTALVIETARVGRRDIWR